MKNLIKLTSLTLALQLNASDGPNYQRQQAIQQSQEPLSKQNAARFLRTPLLRGPNAYIFQQRPSNLTPKTN